jgi:hypothetical protein
MSDSIIVRVTLDAYDMASTGKQTQVYVQIPEVARCSWLLPEGVFHGLKDRAWPEVLDVAHDYITYGGAASNSSSTAAWHAIREWLLDDANRDEMQAAFEEHQARRDPVARKLLGRVAELEAGLPAMQEALFQALDRVTELEAQRAALAARLRTGQTWQQGRTPPLVSQDYVSQDELRAIFGIPLVAPWDEPVAGGAE